MKKVLLCVCLCAASSYVAAADHGVYGGVSTLGLGIGYKVDVRPDLAFRIGYNGGQLDGETQERGVDYDGNLELESVELLADYHPWRNGFSLTAGLLYNKNKLVADGRSTANTVTINGVTYVGTNPSLRYENDLDSDNWSPYLGVGWSSKAPGTRGLSFQARLGVIFQDPKGSLTTSGISGPNLEQNRAEAERELNNDVDDLKVYPVAGIALQYVF